MKRLEGKVALITGGAGNIGAASAEKFLKHGAKVAIVDMSQEQLDKALDRLKEFGEVIAIQADVTKEADVKNYVDVTVNKWGTIDIFFNNAGVLGELKSIIDCSVEDFRRTIDINLTGEFIGMKYVLPVMIKQESGTVINTSSNSGWQGQANMGPYVASKYGVVGITKTAALEVGKYNIRVNCIQPTGVGDSHMKAELDRILLEQSGGQENTSSKKSDIPMGRLPNIDEVSDLVLFLASDESRFISGTTQRIDGGQSGGSN